MGKGRGAWDEGGRAWQRLTGWDHGTPKEHGHHAEAGDDALDALSDVGLLRRLLDQAELGAVRVARHGGKSWAEIATRLGVTRQSAWERWRDLDDAAETAEQAAIDAASSELVAEIDPSAQEKRRRATVRVPAVIGLSWDDAREVLRECGLVAVGPDPDGPPLAALGWPSGVVTDQSPESGAKVPRGSSVRLWVERGGGSAGVREPRRPRPDPKSGRELRPEPSDEAVG